MIAPARVACAMAVSGFFLAPVIAGAAVDQTQSFAAVKVLHPPDPSALVADPLWNEALKANGFGDITSHGAAPLATTAYLLYDSQNIYVAFHCDQSGVSIVADQTTNNVGFGLDDYVGLGIDPSGNGSQVYFFYTTPRGIRYQQASESSRYAPDWTAHAAVAKDGWDAVLAIPLKVLRASSKTARWKIDFLRHVAKVGENYSWAYSPNLRDDINGWPNFSDVRFWPTLTNIQVAVSAARPAPRAELYGLESLGRDRNVFQQATGVFAPQSIRHAGLDVTYPFTSTLAFVGALSPDFSNVEVDQQIIAPQEFPRALKEYRPFFAQGARFLTPNENVIPVVFNAPDVVFYSPDLGELNRGTKVEGTLGLQSIGILNAKGDGFDDTAFGYKHATENKAFSWWADGVMANHPAGRDSTYEMGYKGYNLESGFINGLDYAAESGSFVPDANEARSLRGFAFVQKSYYSVRAEYQDIGPYFNPVDGFTNVNDARGLDAFVDLPGGGTGGSVIKRYDLFVYGDRFLDRSGATRQADTLFSADVTFKNLIHIITGPQTSELRTYTTGFPAYVGGDTFPFHTNLIQLGYRDGTPAPLDFSYTYGPFSSYYLQQYTSSASRQIGGKLTLGLEYDSAHQRFFAGGADGQVLRRISIGEALGADSNISFGFRSINGTGGFATPGVNFSASFHEKYRNDSELFVAYGTPASPASLDRLILKYILRIGGGAGT